MAEHLPIMAKTPAMSNCQFVHYKKMFTWNRLFELWQQELQNMPFILLQNTAVIGIFGLVLIAFRGFNVETTRQKLMYGLIFGVTGYLLAGLVSQFIQAPSKPYLRSDLLFLAGLLGGWRAGGVAVAFIYIARVQFGGPSFWLTNAIDMSLVAGIGALMHPWLLRHKLYELSGWHFIYIWGIRCAANLGGLIFATWVVRHVANIGGQVFPSILLEAIADALLLKSFLRRLLGVIPALPLLYGLLLLIRLDTQHRRERALQLERLKIDPMTSLPNRRALRDHLDERYRDGGLRQTTVVLIEVSNYAEILLTQPIGWNDAIWQSVEAQLHMPRMTKLLNGYAPCAFLYSDTALAVVLHNISSEAAEDIDLAASMQLVWSQELRSRDGTQVGVQLRLCVVGCACYERVDPLMRDLTLHLKSLPPDSQALPYFHQTFVRTVGLDMDLMQMLLRWIDDLSPPMAYQPKCDLRTGELVGGEALLRTIDSTGAAVAPGHVLAVVSRLKLMPAFEWCTIAAVARDAKLCIQQGVLVSLSVNISAESLMTVGFVQRVYDLLRELQLPMDSLTLELTETARLPPVQAVRDNFLLLRKYGIPISLDDFGTGYSGLSALASTTFSEVKIDHGMVSQMAEPRMRSAVQLALESAQRYQASFIAEGVETELQRNTLLELGVTVGQGYLFASALSLADFVRFARTAEAKADLAPETESSFSGLTTTL